MDGDVECRRIAHHESKKGIHSAALIRLKDNKNLIAFPDCDAMPERVTVVGTNTFCTPTEVRILAASATSTCASLELGWLLSLASPHRPARSW
jgi:hypothetical protein